MHKMLLILALALLPNFTKAAVWETTNSWSPQMEEEYAAWVKSDWKVDIFRNSRSPYKTNLDPDCADSVYAMRIIFASENGLPFAIIDPTSGRSIMSNEMKKFDSYPAGTERVHAFLNWIWGVVGTVTLPADSYPIAVNRDAFHPGAFMLAKESKHSYSLKKLNENGTPILYYSTQGNDGDLKVRSWPSEGFLFSAGIKQPSGMRYFRYPQHLRLDAWDVPGFSAEQYAFPAGRWISTAQKRLALRQETVAENLQRHMSDICQLVNTRVELVNKAIAYNNMIGDRCLNYQEFDDLSTPSRDRQTKSAYDELEASYREALRNNAKIPADMNEQIRNIFADSMSDETGEQYCVFKYGTSGAEFIDNDFNDDGNLFTRIFGTKKKRKQPRIVQTGSRGSMTLGELRRRIERGLISSNPNDTGAVRWGDKRGPSEKAARCPIY